jgi:hypothetical protein
VYTDTLTWLSAREDFIEDFNQVNCILVDLTTEGAQLIYSIIVNDDQDATILAYLFIPFSSTCFR